MNRALIWKEFREQGLIVAALVLLGGGVLVAAGLLFPAPPDTFGDMRLTLEPRKLAIVLLVLASGVVIGGTLFAGEREQGTFPYLEILPVPRYRVWLGKILAGLALVLIAAGSLFAVAAVVGVVGPPARLPFWALIIVSLAIAAFSWGSLGSAFAKTSLAACGLGLLSAVALLFVIYPLCALGVQFYDAVAASVWNSNSTVNHAEIALLGTLFGLMVVPMVLSAWIYTAPDRNRFDRDVRIAQGSPVDPPRRRFRLFPTGGFRASLWVVARQNRLLAIVLGGTAVISGLGYLEPSLPVLFVWPVATLMIGTIVGVTGWSDEQNSGAFRFWAERRMPIGRLWLAKVAFGFALIAVLLTAMVLPSLIAARAQGSGQILATAFRARIFLERGFPIAEYLLLWPVYGFAFGHLAGLLFRKAAVGTAVGLMTGGAIVALWLPSLLSGGIHWYQLWIPPLLALATARSLVWSWALDQLGRRRALQRLAFGSSTIAATMLAGILYRMLEIPEDANTDADIAFRATIPPFDTNEAGREIRRGAVLYAEMKLALRAAPATERPLWPDGPSQQAYAPSDLAAARRQAQFEYQVDDVPALGWPADRPDADAWLDACMANDWAEYFVRASTLPIGTVEDPIEMIDGSVFKHLFALQGCETMLLARGLQLQAKGRPEAFVESARACLGLARNLRNKSFYLCGQIGQRVELRTHLAVQRWLEKLGDRPDLLREMLGLMIEHDATCPKLLADANLPEQVLMRNSLNAPTQFVKQYLMGQPYRNRDTSNDREALENETELVAFAWAVPWEKERLRRLVGLGNRRAITRAEGPLYQGLPGFGDYARASAQAADASLRAPELEREELAARRASLLLIALRLHRAEKRAFPATLDALVPAYLGAVPLDPYDDRPFRYRISKGESIAMEALPPPRPAGALVIAGLIGAPGYEIEINSGIYKPAGYEGGIDTKVWLPLLEPLGLLIGIAGHEVAMVKLRDTGVLPRAGVTIFRMLNLPAGRGILWSVGPDRIDDGGSRLLDPKTGASNFARTGDLIYPVPEPAEAKR